MKKSLIISTAVLVSLFGVGAAKDLSSLNQAKVVSQNVIHNSSPVTSRADIRHKEDSVSINHPTDDSTNITILMQEVETLKEERAKELAELEAKRKEREEFEALRRANQIQDNSTPLRRIDVNYTVGTKEIPETLKSLEDQYFYYADMFGVDPYLLMAITSQECGGDLDCTGTAKGISQIEDTCVSDFINFGKTYFGQTWTESDRYNTNCALAYLAHKINVLLKHYNGDFEKAIQAYNFSYFSLDKLINAYGEDWLSHRDEMAYFNGHYDRTGSTSYGDPLYIEHVMRYYSTN